MDVRDLPPRKDPKGGSPRTPAGGIPVRQVEQYDQGPYDVLPVKSNGDGVWRSLFLASLGVIIGLTTAYVTALRDRGMSQNEVLSYIRQSQLDQEKTFLTRNAMEDYVKEYTKEYSPWSFDKQTIVNRLAAQDEKIGELRTKIELAGKYLEQQQKR